jgi:hypothetical protein
MSRSVPKVTGGYRGARTACQGEGRVYRLVHRYSFDAIETTFKARSVSRSFATTHFSSCSGLTRHTFLRLPLRRQIAGKAPSAIMFATVQRLIPKHSATSLTDRSFTAAVPSTPARRRLWLCGSRGAAPVSWFSRIPTHRHNRGLAHRPA